MIEASPTAGQSAPLAGTAAAGGSGPGQCAWACESRDERLCRQPEKGDQGWLRSTPCTAACSRPTRLAMLPDLGLCPAHAVALGDHRHPRRRRRVPVPGAGPPLRHLPLPRGGGCRLRVRGAGRRHHWRRARPGGQPAVHPLRPRLRGHLGHSHGNPRCLHLGAAARALVHAHRGSVHPRPPDRAQRDSCSGPFLVASPVARHWSR